MVAVEADIVLYLDIWIFLHVLYVQVRCPGTIPVWPIAHAFKLPHAFERVGLKERPT